MNQQLKLLTLLVIDLYDTEKPPSNKKKAKILQIISKVEFTNFNNQ